jgi:hypothetical protein
MQLVNVKVGLRQYHPRQRQVYKSALCAFLFTVVSSLRTIKKRAMRVFVLTAEVG